MILDLLFTLGQAASALLLVYGAVLVMLPRTPVREPAREELLLLKLNA